jgi:RNA polymerase sigma-70 factor (ECF subfamily)
VVRDVGRFELEGELIARSRSYFFSPEAIAEVCRELEVPFRTNGYTYWRRGS